MRFSISAALSLLLVQAAWAQTPISGTWIDTMLRFGPQAPSPWPDAKHVGPIHVGELAIDLEVTPMWVVAERMGGAVHRWGEAGEAQLWLCYADGTDTIWFYSDGEMGDGAVTGFALDTRQSPPSAAQCGVWRDKAVAMTVPLPGDSAGEVRQLLGPPELNENGEFAYMTASPAEKLVGFSVWQNVVFRAKGDVIDAIAVFQETGD